jgi:hypothetical protein
VKTAPYCVSEMLRNGPRWPRDPDSDEGRGAQRRHSRGPKVTFFADFLGLTIYCRNVAVLWQSEELNGILFSPSAGGGPLRMVSSTDMVP